MNPLFTHRSNSSSRIGIMNGNLRYDCDLSSAFQSFPSLSVYWPARPSRNSSNGSCPFTIFTWLHKFTDPYLTFCFWFVGYVSNTLNTFSRPPSAFNSPAALLSGQINTGCPSYPSNVTCPEPTMKKISASFSYWGNSARARALLIKSFPTPPLPVR